MKLNRANNKVIKYVVQSAPDRLWLVHLSAIHAVSPQRFNVIAYDNFDHISY